MKSNYLSHKEIAQFIDMIGIEIIAGPMRHDVAKTQYGLCKEMAERIRSEAQQTKPDMLTDKAIEAEVRTRYPMPSGKSDMFATERIGFIRGMARARDLVNGEQPPRCVCNDSCPVHGTDWIVKDADGRERCVTCLSYLPASQPSEAEERAYKKGCADTLRDLTPTPQRETDEAPKCWMEAKNPNLACKYGCFNVQACGAFKDGLNFKSQIGG